jgi:hypothetical protein
MDAARIHARTVFIRRIILLARATVAEYVPGVGARCPVCVDLLLDPPPSAVTSTVGIVRYHCCPVCQNTFKSVCKTAPEPEIEEVAPPVPVVKTTPPVAKRKKKPHRKR